MIRTRSLYVIADKAIGFNPDTDKVFAAYRWTEFSAERHAFTLSTNDRVTAQRAGITSRVIDEFRRASMMLSRWAVSEDRARDELERMGLPRQRRCEDCTAKLPIGALYCLECGLNQTVPIGDQPPGAARL